MGVTIQKKTVLLTARQFAAIVPYKRTGLPGIHKQNIQQLIEYNQPLTLSAVAHKMGARSNTIIEVPITELKSPLNKAIRYLKGKKLSSEQKNMLVLFENLSKEIAAL